MYSMYVYVCKATSVDSLNGGFFTRDFSAVGHRDYRSIVPIRLLVFFFPLQLFIDREAREIMHLVASVCPFVCLFVCALMAEPFDLRP